MSGRPGTSPEHDTERRVSEWLTHGPDELPEYVLQDVIRLTAVTPQAKRRFLGRWLDRDEGVGEAGYTDGHGRGRVLLALAGAAAALALVALAVPLVAPYRDVPAVGGELVVDANGSSAFLTIQDAVAAAEPGAVVRVRAGRYEGPVVVDKDLSLVGDGEQGVVVITAPAAAGAAHEAASGWDGSELDRGHVLWLQDGMVTVSDLTIETPRDGTGLEATGGSPRIERVSITQTGRDVPAEDTIYAMGFYGPVQPVVRESEWAGYVAVRDGAAPTFEANTVSRGGLSLDGPGVSTVRSNTFVDGAWVNTSAAVSTVEGNTFDGGNVSADSGSEIVVRHNTFRGLLAAEGDFAIEVRDVGTRALVAGNVVEDAGRGVWIGGGAVAQVSDNDLGTSVTGINLSSSLDVVLEGNTVTGEGAGIVIVSSGSPTITGNTVEVSGRGIVISGSGSPVIDANAVCGAEADIQVWEGATPDLGRNDLCGDAAG